MMSLIFLNFTSPSRWSWYNNPKWFYQNKAYYYRSDGKQGFDSQMSYSTGLGVDVLLGNQSDNYKVYCDWDGRVIFPASNPEFTEEEGYEYTYPEYDSLA